MRVCIAGGRSRTDYLVESLAQGGNEIVVVNADRAWCEYLSAHHNVPVICGDATKRYVLDDADIEGFDLIIALSDSDADNLVICHMAQRFFGIERQVCTAYNPRNVPVFKKLGITSVISATYLLSKLIEETSFAAMGAAAPASDDARFATSGMMRVVADEARDETREVREAREALKGAPAEAAGAPHAKAPHAEAPHPASRWFHGDGRHA